MHLVAQNLPMLALCGKRLTTNIGRRFYAVDSGCKLSLFGNFDMSVSNREYRRFQLEIVTTVTHNTNIYTFAYDGVYNVPLGHHLSAR